MRLSASCANGGRRYPFDSRMLLFPVRREFPCDVLSWLSRVSSCHRIRPSVGIRPNVGLTRTYLTIIHGCDGIPGAAVPGARRAVGPDPTSDEQRRNAAPGVPSLRVAARKPGDCVTRRCVGVATLPPRALPPGFLAATHPAADYEIGSNLPEPRRPCATDCPAPHPPIHRRAT
jgi:hypothetical protein